jgi:CheY-like chemotaxis protein
MQVPDTVPRLQQELCDLQREGRIFPLCIAVVLNLGAIRHLSLSANQYSRGKNLIDLRKRHSLECSLTGPNAPKDDLLYGLRVLVVEDESLVAMLIEEYLAELGCAVAYSARRVGKAVEALGRCEFDAAVLDVNVAGESVLPVAALLDERKIPFIFASGYGAKGVDSRWADRPVLQKPFSPDELRFALLSSLRSPS